MHDLLEAALDKFVKKPSADYEPDDPRFKQQQIFLRTRLQLPKFYGNYPSAKTPILEQCKEIGDQFGDWTGDFSFYMLALFANGAGHRTKDKQIAQNLVTLRKHKVLPDVFAQREQGYLDHHVIGIRKGKSRYEEVQKFPDNTLLLARKHIEYPDSFSAKFASAVYNSVHEAINKGPRQSFPNEYFSPEYQIIGHIIHFLDLCFIPQETS